MIETPDRLPVPWPDLQYAFRVDGCLRDVVVEPADKPDWQRAYDYVRDLVAAGHARVESNPVELPQDVVEVFALRDVDSPWLHLFLDSVQVNCHFFGELAVEFDVDPREITSPSAAAKLLVFVEGLGAALARPVDVTHDDQRHAIWLTFDPTTRAWAKRDMYRRPTEQVYPLLA
jgi:hypothetical protein